MENDIGHVKSFLGLDIDEMITIILVFKHVVKGLYGPGFNERSCDLVDVLHRQSKLQVGIDEYLVLFQIDGILDNRLNRP